MTTWGMANRIVFLTGPEGNLGPIWKDILTKQGARVFGAGLPEYDLTKTEDIDRAIFACCEQFGTPNVVVHNAAIDNPPGSNASFWGSFEEILAVNLCAAKKVTEALLPIMETRFNFDFSDTPGNVVFIGSMLGFVASNPQLYPPGWDKPVAYAASKAALWALCKNLNTRWAKKGIVSNMLALSAVEGGQDEEFKAKYRDRIPIRRLLEREDFEREFLTVCASRVPYGNPVLVCGGYTIW